MSTGSKLESNIKRVNNFVQQLKEENRELRQKLENGMTLTVEETNPYRDLQRRMEEWKEKYEELEESYKEREKELNDLQGKLQESQMLLEETRAELEDWKERKITSIEKPHVHNERGAGRKRKQPEFTPTMLQEMVREKGIDAIAAELNISKRTLYRRLSEK